MNLFFFFFAGVVAVVTVTMNGTFVTHRQRTLMGVSDAVPCIRIYFCRGLPYVLNVVQNADILDRRHKSCQPGNSVTDPKLSSSDDC